MKLAIALGLCLYVPLAGAIGFGVAPGSSVKAEDDTPLALRVSRGSGLSQAIHAWGQSAPVEAAVADRKWKLGYTFSGGQGHNKAGDTLRVELLDGAMRLTWTPKEFDERVARVVLEHGITNSTRDPAITKGDPNVVASPSCAGKVKPPSVVVACGKEAPTMRVYLGYASTPVSDMAPIGEIAMVSTTDAEGKLGFYSRANRHLLTPLRGELPMEVFAYGGDAAPAFESVGYWRANTVWGETIWVGDKVSSSSFRALRFYQREENGIRHTVIGHIYNAEVGKWVKEFAERAGFSDAGANKPAPGQCDIAQVSAGSTGFQAEDVTAQMLAQVRRHPGYAVRVRCAAPVVAPKVVEQPAAQQPQAKETPATTAQPQPNVKAVAKKNPSQKPRAKTPLQK